MKDQRVKTPATLTNGLILPLTVDFTLIKKEHVLLLSANTMAMAAKKLGRLYGRLCKQPLYA